MSTRGVSREDAGRPQQRDAKAMPRRYIHRLKQFCSLVCMALLSHNPETAKESGASRATERGRAPRDYAAFVVCELLVVVSLFVSSTRLYPVFLSLLAYFSDDQKERGSFGLPSALLVSDFKRAR